MINNELKNVGTAGLKHTYYFMKDLTFTTSVSGEDRSNVVVNINEKSQTIWSCTLNEVVMRHTTSHNIDAFIPVYGNVVIEKGATFTLTLPTKEDDGKVVFNGIVATNPDSQDFKLNLFSWPLKSSI